MSLILNHPVWQDSIVKRIGKNAMWSLSGEVIGRGSSVLAGFMTARILEVNGFGQLGMIRSTIGTFSVFAGFGLGATATRYVAKYRNSDPTKVGEIIGMCNTFAMMLGVIMAICLFVFSSFLARTALAAPELRSALKVGAAMLLFGSMTGAGIGTIAGFEGFRGLAAASAMEGITVLVTTIPLAYLLGVNGAVLALVLSQVVKFIMVRRIASLRCREFGIVVKNHWFKKHLSVIWNYSFPAFLCGFMYGPAIWVLNQIVVRQPAGYKMLGIMSAADQWKTLILFVPAALGNVTLPVLANLRSTQMSSYKRTVLLNLVMQVAIAVCVALPVAIFSGPFASLYGKSFEGLNVIITISCATAIAHTVGNAAGNALMTAATIWPNFLLNMLWAVCLIVSGFFLIRIYGVMGIALSYLIAYLLHGFVMTFFALQLHKR